MESNGKKRKLGNGTKEKKTSNKSTNEKSTNDLFNQKLNVLNAKIDLLNQKENLIDGKLELVNKCKTDIVMEKDDGKIMEKKAKINHSQIYSSCFEYSIKNKETFSPTARIILEQNELHIGPVRALFDTGAQANLIDSSICKLLKADVLPSARTVVGIDGQPFPIKRKVVLKVRPYFTSDFYLEETFWILPKESKWAPIIPAYKFGQTTYSNPFNIPSAIPFADPEFFVPKRIFILLGIEFFAKTIISVISRNLNGIALIETSYGAIIFGGQDEAMDESSGQVSSAIKYTKEMQMDKLLERLWLQDKIESHSNWTVEEKLVEKYFMDTHYRDKDGRFVVKLPLKNNSTDIGSSRAIAYKRFMYLERKFHNNSEFKNGYVEMMDEMIQLGYIQLAKERPLIGEMVYYIPHHQVMKKPRIVYDASCHTDKGISLNDIQMLGPKLQQSLEYITMCLRRHRIALCADIKKMYNQVRINKEQWNLLRLFWRKSSEEALQEYYFTVVPFGLTASAFLAVRSMIQAAREAKNEYPLAAKVIQEDFYMDDLVTGSDSTSKVIKLGNDMDKVLKGAGFELRRWTSNSQDVMKQIGVTMENTEIVFSEVDGTTILGLKWLIVDDKFTFQVKTLTLEGEITKRKVVSCVAQIYDPIGYVSPVIVKGKILIQELWKGKLDWDKKLPDELLEQWNKMWKDIINLEKFKIDRWIGTGGKSKIQIHGFADSSTAAMAAVIYVRVEQPDGKISCNLVTSKTKVAPLKTVTVPRLELSAAELLARLLVEVKKSMEWSDLEYTLWTDSSITIHWIRKEPHELKVYVANRVASIQEKTDITHWKHVDTKSNPADLASRGLFASELVDNDLWLHGPDWLKLPENQWPKSKFIVNESPDTLQELKVLSLLQYEKMLQIRPIDMSRNVSILEYVSRLEKALNIISYVQRFTQIWLSIMESGPRKSGRKRINIKFNPPTEEEKANAMSYLIRKTQEFYYGKEIFALKNGKYPPERSKIQSLNPILDKNGILRVGGRLDRSELEYESKHPAIIPNGSLLSELLLDYAHRKTKHGGIQISTHFLRQKYWIPKIRSELKRCIYKCIVCVRLNAIQSEQLMAELPEDRVQPGKAFCTLA